MGKKIYQIRIWCSDDSCEEFWFDKELSGYFYNFEDAENELKKYDGKTREELEKMCDVVSVRSNVPRIDEFETVSKSNYNTWISIDESMPVDGERVLVKKKDRDYWPWEVAVWNTRYECWDDSEGDDYMCDKNDVGYWMRIK